MSCNHTSFCSHHCEALALTMHSTRASAGPAHENQALSRHSGWRISASRFSIRYFISKVSKLSQPREVSLWSNSRSKKRLFVNEVGKDQGGLQKLPLSFTLAHLLRAWSPEGDGDRILMEAGRWVAFDLGSFRYNVQTDHPSGSHQVLDGRKGW